MSKFAVIAGEGFAPASVQEVMAQGQPARWIQLAVIGENRFRDGRPPLVIDDKAHAERVVAASRRYAGKMQLMVDYDHQSIYGAKAGVGGVAPASGWMNLDAAEVRDDGIWVPVEWTEAAAAKLRAKEYRYVSPLLGFDKKTLKVTRVFNAALTNTPAIDDLAAAASADPSLTPQGRFQGSSMKTIASALGLAETATEEEIAAAAAALRTDQAAVRKALGLADDADGEAIAAAAAQAKTAGSPDPSKYAPIAVVSDLQAKVAALTNGAAERTATEAVAAATAAGKITPAEAQQAWALDYARKDPAGFEAYVAAAAVIVPPAKRQTPTGAPPAGEPTLSDEDRAACAAIGCSEEDFLKARKQELGL